MNIIKNLNKLFKLTRNGVGLCLLTSALFSCGGGGSSKVDTDFLGAARVDLSVSPGKIDTGDRVQVNISISEIHPDGIMLKIKYPNSLKYVRDSSKLVVNNKSTNVTPFFDLENSDEEHFLVYFIRQSAFGSPKAGKLNLELQGIEETTKAEIEVDPDVDNPLVENANEFDAEEPEFSVEDKASVEVLL